MRRVLFFGEKTMTRKNRVGSLPQTNILTFCVSAALSIAAGTALGSNAPTPKSKSLSPKSESTNTLFGEWFAVGSGCKATHKKPGNVSFLGGNLEGNLIQGAFSLEGYKLVSPPIDPKTSLSFARECNVRIQITPPQNKRIVSVGTKASYLASKDSALKLDLQNTLYMDTNMVGAFYKQIPAGEKFGNRDFEVQLSNGVWNGMPPPEGVPSRQYTCGQMMVLGSDFTTIAHRKNKDDSANISLTPTQKQLEFRVELADCAAQ
jgi:hypothetical protein